MSKQKKLLDRLVRCPKCKRNMRPKVLEYVDAIMVPDHTIPSRVRVKCQAIGCGQMFYVVRNASD